LRRSPQILWIWSWTWGGTRALRGCPNEAACADNLDFHTGCRFAPEATETSVY